MKMCQGDCGNCKANYRCCLPALAGFVSPHSTGPGEFMVRDRRNSFKENACKKNAANYQRVTMLAG